MYSEKTKQLQQNESYSFTTQQKPVIYKIDDAANSEYLEAFLLVG